MFFKKKAVAVFLSAVVVAGSTMIGAYNGLTKDARELNDVFFHGVDGEWSISDEIDLYHDYADKLLSLAKNYDNVEGNINDAWFDFYSDNDYDSDLTDDIFIETYGSFSLDVFELDDSVEYLRESNDYDDYFYTSSIESGVYEIIEYSELIIPQLRDMDLSEDELNELDSLEAILLDTTTLELVAEPYNEMVREYETDTLTTFPTNLFADYFYINSRYTPARTLDF